MAHGITNMSKNKPCPICGKPDYCGWDPMEHWNGYILFCKRDTLKCNQIGIDGNRYIYLNDSRSGASKYEEYEQHMTRMRHKQERKYVKNQSSEAFIKAAETTKNGKMPVPVDIIEPKSPDELSKIYHFMLDQLKLENYHRAYLNKQGWTNEMIDHFHVVSFPESDVLRDTFKRKGVNISRRALAGRIQKAFGSDALVGVPGAYLDHDMWTFHGPSGILFPMYDIRGNLYRLRIRMDFRDVNARIYTGFSGIDDYFIKNN